MLRALLNFEGSSKATSENELNGNQQKQLSSQSHGTCLDEQKEDNGSEPATTTLQQKTSDHTEYLPWRQNILEASFREKLFMLSINQY
jgi:hypothetical protein